MKKYVAEFIGTFFLMATIGNVVLKPGDAGDMAPLAIGAALMVMVFANGHLSGAHFNPAVTLAVWLRGRCPTSDVPGYIISQLAGATLAALAVQFLKGNPPVEEIKLVVERALLAEFLYTFALAYVVLNVATAKATSGNSYYGLAIGFAVLAGAYSVGSISGGAFNPAVALGITILGISKASNIWIYLVANLAAGAVAGIVFKTLNPEDV
jgi:aquaporin Z